jgi:energy-coupling factor transporter transmembrane protein EcfT
MADLNLFADRRVASLLHRVDVRCKLLCVVFVSLACVHASFGGLLLLSTFFAVLWFDSSLRSAVTLKSLRWALLLLALVFVARALSEPGETIAVVGGVSVSRQGLYSGMLVSWRLLVIILTGVVLSATTRTAEIRAGVQWLLSPFPRVPAARVATMMSLILRFLPLIFQLAAEIGAAQRARGIERRKHPIYRLRLATMPLLRKSFERADRLALAMEARGFSEQRMPVELSAARVDWVVLALVAGVCLGGVVL